MWQREPSGTQWVPGCLRVRTLRVRFEFCGVELAIDLRMQAPSDYRSRHEQGFETSATRSYPEGSRLLGECERFAFVSSSANRTRRRFANSWKSSPPGNRNEIRQGDRTTLPDFVLRPDEDGNSLLCTEFRGVFATRNS